MNARRPYMTPLKPHMLRAYRTWILENELSAYLVVDPRFGPPEDWSLPSNLVGEGKESICFDCSAEAVEGFKVTALSVQFHACFDEEEWEILIPIDAVTALYAKENGAGIVFDGPEQRRALPLGWKGPNPAPPPPSFTIL